MRQPLGDIGINWKMQVLEGATTEKPGRRKTAAKSPKKLCCLQGGVLSGTDVL